MAPSVAPTVSSMRKYLTSHQPSRVLTAFLVAALWGTGLALTLTSTVGATPAPPPAPTAPVVTPANSAASVTWAASSPGAASIDSYTITAADQTRPALGTQTCSTNLAANPDVAVGTTPSSTALSPDGSTLYVANYASASVSVINTATNAVSATIPVGNGPNALALNANGSTLYVANATDATVSVIDTLNDTVSATIATGATSGTLALSPGGTTLYETNSAANTLLVVSTLTDSITATITVGQGPWGTSLNSNGSTLYVDNSDAATISVINTATNTVTSTFSVPNGVAVSTLNSAGTTLYVANAATSGYLSAVNTGSYIVSSSTAIAGEPTDIVDTPTYVYLSVAGSPSAIYAYSDATGALVATINASSEPIAPAASSSTLYVANAADDSVSSYVASADFAPATTCQLSGLVNGDTYVATLTATNIYGTSAPSAATAFVPISVPVAPTGVYASSNQNAESEVSWTAPSATGGSPVTKYVVKYATSPYTTWTAATTSATGTSYVATGLVNGTSYEFEVAAVNTSGTGTYSLPSLPATPATTPGAPTDLTGVPSNAAVTLTWSAPSSTGGSPITGYSVTASPGAETCNTNTALTCTVTGLINATPYTFRVIAINTVGTSPPSSPSAPLSPTDGPGAPTEVSAVASSAGTSALITWVAPGDNGSPITSYQVSVSPGNETCSTTTATSCSVAGLSDNGAYAVSVTAVNANGTSPPGTTLLTTGTPRTTTTAPLKAPSIELSVSPFKGYTAATTPAGRAQLRSAARRLYAARDTAIVVYTYVTGLHSATANRTLAAARARVVEANIRADLRLLGTADTVSAKYAQGSTRTYIKAH